MVWNRIQVVVAQHYNVPNATELFTLKCLILCYVNFASMKTIGILFIISPLIESFSLFGMWSRVIIIQEMLFSDFIVEFNTF